MEYRQIPPQDYLKNYIRYFWTLESDDTEILSRSFRTIVEGNPGLIFQSPEKGAMYQYGKKLPHIFLYGQATRHAEIHFGGSFNTIGICFHPHAIKTIFGYDPEELTNACTCLDQEAKKDGFFLSEQIADAGSVTEQIEMLSSYLFFMMMRNNKYEDKTMQFAISRIIQSKGSIAMKELQTELQLTERSFERRFKQYVGVSPKLFSRISRFQASLNELRFGKHDKLTDLAYENEYADQSHFIRSFNEFAGCSPLQYQKASLEAVENFYENGSK